MNTTQITRRTSAASRKMVREIQKYREVYLRQPHSARPQ